MADLPLPEQPEHPETAEDIEATETTATAGVIETAEDIEAADADRGFLAPLSTAVVTDADGRVVWDGGGYAFLGEECPPTAHPELWRRSRLDARQGLYEVVEGVYQVRGLDLANMTLIEGDTGVVIVDPLASTECAAAALRLYRAHRGDRPVTAVVHTHPDIDHFGGVRGVTAGDVPVLAPAGFLEHAATQVGHAAPALARRASYTRGSPLSRSAAGRITPGLALSAGTVSLLPPTVHIERTGREETLDGVRMTFQLIAGPPPELAVLLPERRALLLPEHAACHRLPPRGLRRWAHRLTETLTLFTGHADVALAAHRRPVWGAERVAGLLARRRDLYAYLHDQSVRLMNKGLTGPEIAERLRLPPALEREWPASAQHARAVYADYLGWYDGNPAHLWEHPPRQSAIRYLECLGGGAAVVALARKYAAAGDLRFAAQLLNHAVFADEGDKQARDLLAEVYTRLGHGARDATWRHAYLTGARELTDGIVTERRCTVTPEVFAAFGAEQIFDALAVRVDGPRAWNESLAIDWHLTDLGRCYRTTLSNGALVVRPDPPGRPAELTLRLTRTQLVALLMGRNVEGVTREGDTLAFKRLMAVLDDPVPDFAVVTP